MKKLPVPTEYQEQRAVIAWARNMAEMLQDGCLAMLHGDATGVRVPIGCAVKMQAAGAYRGFPDLFLPVALESAPGQYYCCGLFIELKRRKGGVVSNEQRAVHDFLRRQGYAVEVCRGSDEAIDVIKVYLGL